MTANQPIAALDAVEQALQRPLNTEGGYHNPCPDCIDNEPILREALAHLATLRQQVAELVAFREAHEWRPIETAPKDGSHVLLSWPDGAVSLSHFKSCDGFNDSKWVSFGLGGGLRGCSGFNPVQPTHWQPLPTPPAAEGGLPQ